MTRLLTPFLTELWRITAAQGKPVLVSDMRHVDGVMDLCRTYHLTLRRGLERLAEAGYLRYGQEPQQTQPRYWYTAACRIPLGCSAPNQHVPEGAEVAAPRHHNNRVMPIDTSPLMAPASGPAFEHLRLPSRRGDKLHYRDGRVTDLDGNPL